MYCDRSKRLNGIVDELIEFSKEGKIYVSKHAKVRLQNVIENIYTLPDEQTVIPLKRIESEKVMADEPVTCRHCGVKVNKKKLAKHIQNTCPKNLEKQKNINPNIEVVFCNNCGKSIPKKNYRMHLEKECKKSQEKPKNNISKTPEKKFQNPVKDREHTNMFARFFLKSK